jgi:hypothetical protein
MKVSIQYKIEDIQAGEKLYRKAIKPWWQLLWFVQYLNFNLLLGGFTRVFKIDPSLQTECVIAEDGITTTNSATTKTLNWGECAGYASDESYVVLWKNSPPKLRITLPKRSFSEEEWNELNKMIHEKVVKE